MNRREFSRVTKLLFWFKSVIRNVGGKALLGALLILMGTVNVHDGAKILPEQ